MKLATKLTAICATVLLLASAALSGAMLWQVREQSYQSLTQRSEEKLYKLTHAFTEAVIRDHTAIGSSGSQNVFLKYCFQKCGAEDGVLARNGELLSAPAQIDPRNYLDVSLGGGVQSARCSAAGKHYLVLGCALEWKQSECQVYLVSDASFIHMELAELLGRFVLMALCICGFGLFGVGWLVRGTLSPLSQLQKTTEYIAGGNYAERVRVPSKDEVGLLADNFNRMVAAVEAHVQALTEKNTRQQLFIGSVTHEFKTPLTSLLLNVDTLRTVYLPEEKQQELLEAMDVQLHWLEQMVHKLLKLISLGKTAQIRRSSVLELLEQVQEMTKGAMEKYGTELKIICTVDTLPMDKDLMCSALVNLVENSAKASSPGQTILLRGTENTIEVADSGRGIPEKDLTRVTEPFYMGDPSRSKVNGGFGLGLALVKEIADVHGASLEIQSTPNEGTTVRLIFSVNGN